MRATQPALRIVPGDAALMQRREFDNLGRIRRPGTTVRRVEAGEIGELLAFAGREIPVLSSAETVVARVMERNRDSIWAFERENRAVGIYAMLHLSRDGLEALLLGELNGGAPDPDTMVPTGAAPAAIYKWAVVAPGPAIAGVCAMSRMLQADTFAAANLYARPTTRQARTVMAHLGFRDVRSGCPDLQRYVRIANRRTDAPDHGDRAPGVRTIGD